MNNSGRTGKYSIHASGKDSPNIKNVLQEISEGEGNGSIMEEPRFKESPEASNQNDDHMYVVEKIVQHVGSKPHLMHVVQWYGCSTAEDTAKFPHHILLRFINA